MLSDLDFMPHLITHTLEMDLDFKGFSWVLWVIEAEGGGGQNESKN